MNVNMVNVHAGRRWASCVACVRTPAPTLGLGYLFQGKHFKLGVSVSTKHTGEVETLRRRVGVSDLSLV